LLGAAQLAGCHHLHRLRDLLGRFDRVDPNAQGLEARHNALPFVCDQAKVLASSSSTAFSLVSISGVIAWALRMSSRMSACLPRTRPSRLCSKRPTSPTGILSR